MALGLYGSVWSGLNTFSKIDDSFGKAGEFLDHVVSHAKMQGISGSIKSGLNALSDFGDSFGKACECLDHVVSQIDSVASLGSNYQVKSKAREVIFQTRLVLASVLEELIQLRSFRRVAVDALWSIKGEFEFMEISTDKFLEDYMLSKYKSYFEEEDIIKAYQLLDEEVFDVDDIKSVMKPASYKRLKEALRKAKSRKHFLENEMKTELDQAGEKCQQKSKEVTGKLDAACKELSKVMSDLYQSLTDERERRILDKWTWATRGFLFGALTPCSGVALLAAIIWCTPVAAVISAAVAVPSLTVTGVSVEEYVYAKNDVKAIEERIKDMNKQHTQWENHVQLTIRSWSVLIEEFLRLLGLLKENGDALNETEKKNMASRLDEANSALDKFDQDIDKLEAKIKRITCN